MVEIREKMRIAVIGATGLVGQKMLEVLSEQNIAIDELVVAASERSIGKSIIFNGVEHRLVSVEDTIGKTPDIAIFSGFGGIDKIRSFICGKRHIRYRQQLGMAQGGRHSISGTGDK